MEPDFAKDGNFFRAAFYKAFKDNDSIIISGIVMLTFNWDNYDTFGIKNLSSEKSIAYFRYADTGETINYNFHENFFTIYAKENRPIIFSAKMIAE